MWAHIVQICDRIWENPAYCPNAHIAQCTFLVHQVKKCQSPVFFTSMSENLSINLCRRIQRVSIWYQGEISLHFDLPSLYSCRTRSPLLRELIRIPVRAIRIQLDSSNYCTFTHLLSFLGIEEAALDTDDKVWDYFVFISNSSAQVYLIDFPVHA